MAGNAHCHIWAAGGSVQIFTKVFYIRHTEYSRIIFHIKRTVPIYKTVLEAGIEFMKLWKLSPCIKDSICLWGCDAAVLCKWFLAFQRMMKGTLSFEMSGSTQ
jgi:hypothetical protein